MLSRVGMSGWIFCGILWIIFVSGCMTSVGKKYYQVYLNPNIPVSGQESDVVSVPKIDKTILIEAVEVDDIYNDYRIVYRKSPFQLNYYSYHFWIKKPNRMLGDAVRDYLLKGNRFKALITDLSQGNPDWVFRGMVYIMEEYDRPGGWSAHLKMDIEVKDFKTHEIILKHQFDSEELLLIRKVAEVPIGISRILEKELHVAVSRLQEKK